ncbi:sugar phosphate isomerase/epimerase family protein [Urbifossiella limnaea]|uniref:Inosose dehydratase n=1 Tax=Urbifossiella limnaea TaxID=2528023 RepID=A0A517XSB9_9BACT|nr:sugar phosphate isomerase/epimerase [Urbifossiella limnaea]QDU20383.1 Inosose dehydratase [Urbifossiella limnaea]
MPRPVLLFSGPWADVPLDALAGKAAAWGYDGFELCCWGDHLEVQRALSDDTYGPARLDLLARSDLQVPVVANHKVGQAVCDPIDKRHQGLLPDYVWGDGRPEGVRQRATEEMTATFRLAERLGAGVVSGFTGSPIWGYVAGYPAPRPDVIADALKEFAAAWHPILDAARDCGVRFACEVHPGQLAFDLYSAEVVLDALGGREEFGFLFDPSHLHWQGVDPAAFLRRFPDRIYHVHVKDAQLTLDGRAGLLAGYWPSGDPRAGWQFRSPGHGGIDWPGLVRVLNEIGYDGPLAVDWHDPGMDREYGAADACRFVKAIDVPAPARR